MTDKHNTVPVTAELAGSAPAAAADTQAMDHALQLAAAAARAGDVPVGAVVLSPTGDTVAAAHNNREAACNITGHAEILALTHASTLLGSRRLAGHTLVVTLEPCVMCAGAILASGVSRVVFGAWDDKAGAAGSVYDLLRDGRLPHPTPEVVAGVRQEQAAQLLTDFFKQQR